jgi:zinc transporter 11
MVEPIAGVFGALAVVVAEPLLPYALAFAAGAMIYVVIDDIVPEAQMW